MTRSSSEFIVMRNSHLNFRVEDAAALRARPIWISADENRDMLENDILLESSGSYCNFSIGRSKNSDVNLNLKAVSSDHCRIEYNRDMGWFIHESGKPKLS